MTTWILRLDTPLGPGPRVAVKDLLDVEGTPTTAGCRAVAAAAEPASCDAPVVAAVRAGGGRIVGKANLHELAFGGTGVNPWYGTPVNPLDATRMPGGSSSGCAVAVANGEADVAIGSDTAGSVRTPSACCGTAGLKTTFGRVSVEGVWPLAPSLDTVGPMARDVAGVVRGMALLEPGFAPAAAATTVGRLRIGGTDPDVDRAVDALLAACELDVVDVELPGWAPAAEHGATVLFAEAWRSDGAVFEGSPAGVGDAVRQRLEAGRAIPESVYRDARAAAAPWRAELAAAFTRVEVIALPTLPVYAPRLEDPNPDTRTTNAPVNLAGVPSLALPVPSGGPLPASLQLIGPHGSEALLCGTGLVLEAAGAAR
jgi:amidase